MRGLLIGKTALLPMLRSASLLLSIGTGGSQEVLALQRVYVIDARKQFGHEQTSSLDTTLIERFTQFVDAVKVNLRKHRSTVWHSAVPNLGVTCPHFFRCEAPFWHHHEIECKIIPFQHPHRSRGLHPSCKLLRRRLHRIPSLGLFGYTTQRQSRSGGGPPAA